MEFSIKKKILLDCLVHFRSDVERRNTIPILSNIKISALEGGLTLTATDLVMELSEKLVADVKSVGGVTISSQLFFEIIIAPSFDNDSLKLLKMKKNRIILKQKNILIQDSIVRSCLNGYLFQDRHKISDSEFVILELKNSSKL